jgi:hypothetical protein
MARMKSYTASANKGKGDQVFWNNCIARGQKAAKSRAKDKEREQRASERAYERRIKAERKERAAEEKRVERESIKAEKAQNKLNEKVQKYFNRLIEDFRKKNLILTEDVALEIIKRAFAADITIAQLKKYYVDGYEEELLQKTSASILASMVENLLTESSVEEYSKRSKHKKIVSHLIEKQYSTLEEIAADSQVKSYCNEISEKEKHLSFRRKENKKIEIFLKNNIQEFLPDDFYSLDEYVGEDQGKTFTVQSIEESSVFQNGKMKKKKLVSQVNKKFQELITS